MSTGSQSTLLNGCNGHLAGPGGRRRAADARDGHRQDRAVPVVHAAGARRRRWPRAAHAAIHGALEAEGLPRADEEVWKTPLKTARGHFGAFGDDGDVGVLTPLGEAMAALPIGPRHARMLLAAAHSGVEGCLAAAVAAAAALSLDSPFLRDDERRASAADAESGGDETSARNGKDATGDVIAGNSRGSSASGSTTRTPTRSPRRARWWRTTRSIRTTRVWPSASAATTACTGARCARPATLRCSSSAH